MRIFFLMTTSFTNIHITSLTLILKQICSRWTLLPKEFDTQTYMWENYFMTYDTSWSHGYNSKVSHPELLSSYTLDEDHKHHTIFSCLWSLSIKNSSTVCVHVFIQIFWVGKAIDIPPICKFSSPYPRPPSPRWGHQTSSTCVWDSPTNRYPMARCGRPLMKIHFCLDPYVAKTTLRLLKT